MRTPKLKIGDQIRIIAVPGVGIPNYTIHPDTTRAYLKLIARNRPLRIARIDEYGQPWFDFRFKRKNGKWEHHTMCIFDSDDNWVIVKKRTQRDIR